MELATQALLDQVFLDGVFGSFDSAPMLTNGCEDTFRCIALTPFGVFGPWVDLGIAFNNDVGTDTIGFGGWGTANNSLTSGQVTFARWTVGPAVAMPEPTSLAVFALGLFVLGLSRRRHQR